MKKMIALLLAVMIVFGGCYAETMFIPDGAEVIVIFAQQDKQPFTMRNGRIEYPDTIRICFTDYSFVRYAVMREQKFQNGLNMAEYESDHTYNPFET